MARNPFRLLGPRRSLHPVVALLCAALLVPGEGALLAQEAKPAAAAPAAGAAEQAAPKIPADQLDSLVAPIALYPDSLLAQTLAASTYPLEIIQLQQWLAKNPKLKDKALADAVAKQPWDPAVQSMAPLPDVVKRLADDVQWTTDLGNAFLAQQSDVMDAVQRMRKKAQGQGSPRLERAAEGRDEGRRAEDGHHRGVGQPRGHLRPGLQPDGRLPAARLPVPADLLPALSTGRGVLSRSPPA